MGSRFGRRAEIIDAIEKRLCRIKRKNLFTNEGVPDDDYHFDIALVQKDFPHISSLINTDKLVPDRAGFVGGFQPSTEGIEQAGRFIKAKYKTLPALFLQYGNLGSVNDREETVGPNPHLGSSRFTNINQLEERLVIVIRGILEQHDCKPFKFVTTSENNENSENPDTNQAQSDCSKHLTTLTQFLTEPLKKKVSEPCVVDREPYNLSPCIAQIHFKVEIPCDVVGSVTFLLDGKEEAKVSGDRYDCEGDRNPIVETLVFSAQDENTETNETKVMIEEETQIKTIRKNSQKYFHDLDYVTVNTNIKKEDDLVILYRQQSTNQPPLPLEHNDSHWDGTTFNQPQPGVTGDRNKWIVDTLPALPATNLYACLARLSIDKNHVDYSNIIDLTNSDKVPSDPANVRFIYKDTTDSTVPTTGQLWKPVTNPQEDFTPPDDWQEGEVGLEAVKKTANPKVALAFLGTADDIITYSEPLALEFNDFDDIGISISSLPIPLTTLVSMLHADVNKALFEPKKNNLLEVRTAAGLIKEYYENGFPEDDSGSSETVPPDENGNPRLYPDTGPYTADQKLRKRVDNLISDKNKVEQPADLSLGINGVEDYVITDWFTMEGIGTPYELIDFRLVVWHTYPKGSSI